VAKTTFDVIVNATSVGMAGNKQQTILEEKELNAKLVFDMVYNPLETTLLRHATSQGSTVISGLEMFLEQAGRQFEIWTGAAAPRSVMEKAALEALAPAC